MESEEKPGNQAPSQHEVSNDMVALQNYLNENDPIAALCNADIIDPIALGFIPKATWSTWKQTSVTSLHESYFSKKNSVSRRFEHKLWNCLRITTAFPNLAKIIGVVWVNNRIIKVYKKPFAKFLSINCVDGGLFHKQGNFTRHGFLDLNEQDAQRELPPEAYSDVDYRDVHLICHESGQFTTDSTEESIANCKWVDPAPTTRIAQLKYSTDTAPAPLE